MRRLLGRLAATAAIVLISAGTVGSAEAGAEAPPLFTQIPSDGQSGSAAGQLVNPRSVTVDSSTGHVFVGESNNQRISEFTPWGEFIKAWGWGVLNGEDKLQVCTEATGCQEGEEGSGSGQFNRLNGGMVVDSDGNLYAVDLHNHRVQKFDPDGDFLLMFGGEVNKTSGEDVCTQADLGDGDICGIGITDTGPGEFSEWAEGGFIDIGPGGTVFVGDEGRIQEFNPDGTYKAEIPLPQARRTKSLTIDQAGAIYVALDQDFNIQFPEVPFAYRLHPTTGAVLQEIEVAFAEALGVDSAGNLYVAHKHDEAGQLPIREVVQFSPSGTCIPGLCPGEKFAKPEAGVFLIAIAAGSGCNEPSDTLYTTHFNGSTKSYVRAFGSSPDPDVCEPPQLPPGIEQQYAVSAGTDGATVRAEISPEFWPTTYYVEYGTEKCSLGGCEQVLAPGVLLANGKRVNFPLRSSGVFLGAGKSLQPDTTYFFRFVAQSDGGGPVKGEGGEVGVDGGEGTFTTFPTPDAPNQACANQVFRTGPSAQLPDCRAYEMVSPLDKDNGDASLPGENARLAQHNQASLDGQRFTYSSYQPFADPKAAPAVSQYLATRDPGNGWTTAAISPPRGIRLIASLRTLHTEYGAFSPDLCTGWLRHDTDHAPFAPDAIAGFSNLYSRANCGGGPFSAITALEPPIAAPNASTEKFVPELQGVSTDGACTVFRANARLTSDSSSAVDGEGNGVYQLYESCDGDLRLISLLPGGAPCALGANAGTLNLAASSLEGRADSIAGAVSGDGEEIYWSCGGTLYLRDEGDLWVEGDEETIAVSSGQARFWSAALDGSSALFTVGEELREFNLASKASTPVAQGVKGLLGTSRDGQRSYLASTAKLATEATAGKPNLYLREGGAFAFVAELAASDVNVAFPFSVVSPIPASRSTRVSPDGEHLAFMSSSPALSELSAEYDNSDVDTGEPDAEVFLYDAEANEVVCVSCHPTGARPAGRQFQKGSATMGVAAKLPTWMAQLYPERALAENGSRLYFESYEGLVLRDTNGGQDVYQWEAEGSGDCDQSDAAFSEKSGGCVSLISSGESDQDSEFLDATPTGTDVFIATASGLVPQDYGLGDVYDAKVGGGFPPPPVPRPPCEGEACQSPPPPPDDPTPASAAFVGPGRERAKGRCPKGKHRVQRHGKARCVKNKKRGGKKGGDRRRGRAAR